MNFVVSLFGEHKRLKYSRVPAYNLSGLSTDSFETLVQALFLKIVAPGGIIFGSGPDGAREATFEGKMNYHPLLSPGTVT